MVTLDLSKIIEFCPRCGQRLQQGSISITPVVIMSCRYCEECGKAYHYVETNIDDRVTVTIDPDE